MVREIQHAVYMLCRHYPVGGVSRKEDIRDRKKDDGYRKGSADILDVLFKLFSD